MLEPTCWSGSSSLPAIPAYCTAKAYIQHQGKESEMLKVEKFVQEKEKPKNKENTVN